jgi:SAM-dependent methyltransferase
VDAAEERRDAIRALWEAGDYPEVAARFEPVSRAVVDHLDVGGLTLLDAATGTGNTALAAARAGAEVAAFDLSPQLLGVARRRAEVAGLRVDWRIGDLVEIPWPADAVDVVTSTFGAFTVDDARRCAAELARVCRPGGRIVVTAWHPEGAFGRLQTELPATFPDLLPVPEGCGPLDWADHDGLAAITAGLPVVRTDLDVASLPLTFTDLDDAIAWFDRVSGPFQRMRGALRQGGVDPATADAAVRRAWAPVTSGAGDRVAIDAVWSRATLTLADPATGSSLAAATGTATGPSTAPAPGPAGGPAGG